ncbi:MAG: DNRLRE domain-containing protein, partial [Candidatus Krumholzibacteriota bacterium]|nr:DNRLRE domain-containing protein [Candidatus Krumholzibacteriota bacterium]
NDGLPNPKVRRLAEHDGKIYVATWGGGVGIYDIAGDMWTKLSTTEGLVNDLVSDIHIFGDNLYFATNGGVTFYDPVADTAASFVPHDEIVSGIEIAQTPRGLEHVYIPRVEFGIDPGTEGDHGITIARSKFDAAPDTVRLLPTKDNTMYEADGSLSNGAGEYLFAGTGADAMERRALIHFDIAGNIPPNSRIERVRLKLRMTSGPPNLARISLFPATQDWGESTSQAGGDESQGGAAQTGDATWLNTFYPGATWNTPGGDMGELSVRIPVRDTQSYILSTPKMISDVKEWLGNPSQNFGWIMVGEDSVKVFGSRQSGITADRPELEVVYRQIQVITPVDSDLPGLNVTDILYDSATDLYWLTFATEGIATMDISNRVWNFFTTSNGLPTNQVYAITRVNGVLWVATQNGIARQMAGGNWRGYNSGAGLIADRVRRVYSDDPRRIWLSYISAGGGRVDPDSAE